jgi:hypothetical protein
MLWVDDSRTTGEGLLRRSTDDANDDDVRKDEHVSGDALGGSRSGGGGGGGSGSGAPGAHLPSAPAEPGDASESSGITTPRKHVVRQARWLAPVTDAGEVTAVASERDLLRCLAEKVRDVDADFLLGYELEKLSWGYLVRRGDLLGAHEEGGSYAMELSRMPGDRLPLDNPMAEYYSSMSTDLVVPGRVMLNGWRLMMKELPPMTQYDFHSVAYQVMRARARVCVCVCVCVCVRVCVIDGLLIWLFSHSVHTFCCSVALQARHTRVPAFAVPSLHQLLLL